MVVPLNRLPVNSLRKFRPNIPDPYLVKIIICSKLIHKCEIDRSASAFLPNLKPGEAAILGADFPIPLPIQIKKPTTKPNSDGPDFQKAWKEV
jgi:hypothetical protein